MSAPTHVRSRRVLLHGGGSDALALRIGPATLAIADGKILAVQEGEAAEVSGDAVEVLDLGDKLLTPAFVNAHTHLALCGLRGATVPDAASTNRVESMFFDFERKLSAADVQAFSRIGAYESLLAGVGTVWDHYYFGDAVAQALVDVGICGVVAPTIQDLSGPGVGAMQRALDCTLQLHQSSARAAQGVFAALGPHATDTVSGEAWGRIADLAAAHQLPVHVHVAQSPEEVGRIAEREACDPVTWLQRLGIYEAAPTSLSVHGIFAPLSGLAALGTSGRHHAVVCPRAQQVFGMLARVDRWHAASVPWLVATDAAASNDAMDVRAELAVLASLRSAGGSASPALGRLLDLPVGADPTQLSELAAAAWQHRAAAWRSFDTACAPAALLSRVWGRAGATHPRFRTGVIAPGALANLVVWELEHPATWPASAGFGDALHTLVYANASAAIWNVMTLGEWRGEGGNFAGSILASPAWRDAKTEADQRLAALRAG